MKSIAIIPCLNEATMIGELVTHLCNLVDLTMVVDDSSTDETVANARDAGAYVIKKLGKHGFGSSVKAGIDEALLEDYDIIVTLDGDGQHDPKEIMGVMEPIEKGEADVVIGSRFIIKNSNVPSYREFGIKVITWLYNIGSKQKISDSQCCFRAYKQEVLRAIPITESGFTFSTEILIRARALGFRIEEIPVKVLYHKKLSQNSTMNPIRQGIGVAWGTVKLRVKVELFGKMKSGEN